jgi:hypothetical protein
VAAPAVEAVGVMARPLMARLQVQRETSVAGLVVEATVATTEVAALVVEATVATTEVMKAEAMAATVRCSTRR